MVGSARSAPPLLHFRRCSGLLHFRRPPLSKGVVCREPFARMIPKGGKDTAAHVWGEEALLN